MKFNEDRRSESRFWDHTFPQAEFDKSNKKYKVTADKKRWEKLFEEKNMMMVYLRRGRIPTSKFLPSSYILIETRGRVLLKSEGLM